MPQYNALIDVLHRALKRATDGKGKERHATDEPFEQQVACRLARCFGYGAPLAQVVKKCTEAPRLYRLAGDTLGRQRAKNEILDAIVYAAVAVIALDAEDAK